MKMLYGKAFVITFSEDVIIQILSIAHSDESAFKRTSIIQDNKMTETEFHQNMLHELGCQRSGAFIRNRNDNDKLTHVVHIVHECYVIVGIRIMT